MKKILSFVMITVLVLNISMVNVFAVNDKRISIIVNGTYVTKMDIEPFVEDSRTLVPVRAVAEKMGAEVFWDDDTQTVTINRLCDKITYQDKEYKNCTTSAILVIGKKEITITLTDENGLQVFSVTREMDVSAKTVNSRMVIPARFVGYALGYSVDWDANYRLPGVLTLDGGNPTVIYKFIGKQTIDFGISSEDDYDPVKRIDYEYDKEKYPEKIVVNDIEYPSRKGYGDIVIVDATNGRFEGTKMINVFPYRWTGNNVIIECDDEQYKISENKTFEENLKAYSKFYTDKVGEKIIDKGGNFFWPEFLTVEAVAPFGFKSGKYVDIDLDSDNDYVDKSKTYYYINNRHPDVDCTNMYYIIDDPSSPNVGKKSYGWKFQELFSKGNEKNTLMFLNSFLGETGHRIWTMMHEYYTMSGHSYVPYDTEWTKKYLVNVDFYYGPVSYYMPENLDGMPTDSVQKYGFTVVDNIKIDFQKQLLILKTDKQIIYIEYCLPNISTGGASFWGYSVYFETIEN